MWLFLKHSTIRLLKTQFTWIHHDDFWLWVAHRQYILLSTLSMSTLNTDTHNHASSWNPELSCNLKNLFTQREEYFYTRQAGFCMRRQLRKKQDHGCTYNLSTERRKRAEKSHLRFSFTAGFGGWRDDCWPCPARGGCQGLGGSRGAAGPRWALGRAVTGAAPRAAPPTSPQRRYQHQPPSPLPSSSSPLPRGAGLLRLPRRRRNFGAERTRGESRGGMRAPPPPPRAPVPSRPVQPHHRAPPARP